MDILDEVRNDFTKVRILKFLQTYSSYFIIVFVLILINTFLLFYWNNYERKLLSENGKIYNTVVDYQHPDIIKNLRKLQEVENIYGDLAKLKVSDYYLKLKNLSQVISTYQLILESKKSIRIHKDYAQLMIIKIRLLSSTINNKELFEIYKNYHKDVNCLKTSIILSASLFAIKNDQIYSTVPIVNELLSCEEIITPSLFFIKMVNKTLHR